MKSPALKVQRDERRVLLTGALEIENVASSLENSAAWLDSAEVVDLSGLERIDSAGLALLLMWKQRRPSLRFDAVPEDLCALARLSDVDELLGMQPGEPLPSQQYQRSQSTSIS